MIEMKFEALRAPMEHTFRWILATMVVVGLAALVACVSEQAPTTVPSTFDRSWSAALAAAQDEGVRITSENRGTGVIRGLRGEQQVTISVQPQTDGGARVEISARGPKGSDPGLAGRISRAYDRRMGG